MSLHSNSNFNRIPLIKWKAATMITEISPVVKQNTNVNSNANQSRTTNNSAFLRAQPLKIYRKEIAVNTIAPISTYGSIPPQNGAVTSQCIGNSRATVKIDDLNMPGGSTITRLSNSSNGLMTTLDPELIKTTNQTQTATINSLQCLPNVRNANNPNSYVVNSDLDISIQMNALKRTRSSGMMRKKFNPLTNANAYYSDTTQYLVSRNRNYDKQQYHYFRSGNAAAVPGSAGAANNVYATNGINPCAPNTPSNYVPTYYKPNNPRFAKQGSASSSSLIALKKYNAITTNGLVYQTAYGSATANALSAGVPTTTYTVKDKIGFPIKRVPTFTKNGQQKCNNCYVVTGR